MLNINHLTHCLTDGYVDITSMECVCRVVNSQSPIERFASYNDVRDYWIWAEKNADSIELSALRGLRHVSGVGISQNVKYFLNIGVEITDSMVPCLTFLFARCEQLECRGGLRASVIPLEDRFVRDPVHLRFPLYQKDRIVKETIVATVVPTVKKTNYTQWMERLEKVVGHEVKENSKGDTDTYVNASKAKNYVASTTYVRIQDMLGIIRNLKAKKIAFPGDGVGVGGIVCDLLGVPCISGDLSPAMVSLSAKIGTQVIEEDAIATLKRGIGEGCDTVVISHLLTFVPGLASTALDLGYNVIVYEHDTWYKGVSRLLEPIQGFHYLRASNLDIWRNIPIELSLATRKTVKTYGQTDWYDRNNVYLVTEQRMFATLARMGSYVTNLRIVYEGPNIELASEFCLVMGFTLEYTATHVINLCANEIIESHPIYTITRGINLKHDVKGQFVRTVIGVEDKVLKLSYPALLDPEWGFFGIELPEVDVCFVERKGPRPTRVTRRCYLLSSPRKLTVTLAKSRFVVDCVDCGYQMGTNQSSNSQGERIMAWDVETKEMCVGIRGSLTKNLLQCASHGFVAKGLAEGKLVDSSEVLVVYSHWHNKKKANIDFSASGCVSAGESFDQCIAREASEEIPGIKVSSWVHLGTKYPDRARCTGMFLDTKDAEYGAVSAFYLGEWESGEIGPSMKWMSYKELKREVKERRISYPYGPFNIPAGDGFVKLAMHNFCNDYRAGQIAYSEKVNGRKPIPNIMGPNWNGKLATNVGGRRGRGRGKKK